MIENQLYISENPLILSHYWQKAHENSAENQAGAVVLFSGEVRKFNKGKEVISLEYEAHQTLAQKMMQELKELTISKFGLTYADCVHRIGNVALGDCAVIVITSHPHRKEAYRANEYMIEVIKHEVPIWKKEIFADGSHLWGNNCGCHPDGHESHILQFPKKEIPKNISVFL